MASNWDAIRRRVSDLGRAHVRAGVVGPPAHEQHRGSDLTVAELATIHELGNPRTGLVRRSFIAATCDDPAVQAGFVAMEARLISEVINGRVDRNVALAMLGGWMAQQIRDRISSGRVTPPLAPSTVARKHSSIPLLDQGQLLDAIGYEIVG